MPGNLNKVYLTPMDMFSIFDQQVDCGAKLDCWMAEGRPNLLYVIRVEIWNELPETLALTSSK